LHIFYRYNVTGIKYEVLAKKLNYLIFQRKLEEDSKINVLFITSKNATTVIIYLRITRLR
jgi:hypothetical protein